MKFQTLPVKRRPASQGIFRRLSAVTRSRKQRVAASANPADLEEDNSGSMVSRALIIIFLFHIVVIGLIFIHQHFLAGRPPESTEISKAGTAEVTATAGLPPAAESAALTPGEQPYIVKAGDSYAKIATTAGVDENALRLLNKHVNLSPGLILKTPPPATTTTATTATTTTAAATATVPPLALASTRAAIPDAVPDGGLVDAAPVDVSGAPKARLVRANTPREPAAAPPAAAGKAYVVQQGDSIWRIAHRSKVSQDLLLRANGISDARKIKPGMKLIIPKKENSKS